MKNADDFIKEHAHINYCEAIIHVDGLIEYAIPSHVETMIRITGEDRDVIWDKMPITASPIHWLIEYTGCMPVWTNGYMSNKPTIEQIESLFKLIQADLVENKPII